MRRWIEGFVEGRRGIDPKDRDLRVAINPLVDANEASRRGDVRLGRLLDDAERLRFEPPAFDERGERRRGETLAVGRIEEGERERTAGWRRAEPRRIGAPDAGHAAERERLDIGAQKRARLRPIVDEEGEARAARKRLDRERARAREQVDHPRALDSAGKAVLEDIEDRLAQALRGRANCARGRRRQRAAL